MYKIFVELCEKNGITAYKVCKDLKISQGTISNWKNRGTNLNIDTLKKIADYFGVSVDYMLGANEIEYDSASHTWEAKDYYESEDAKEMAQFLFENPEHKVLFDACRKVKAEDMAKALKAIGIFIDEE